MSSLIFNEEAMINGNIFKYESRLKSHTMKYLGESALLVTYYNIRDNATTVDRGLQDIAELFGNKSPLRFNKIENFPIYGFGQANPSNTDELVIEDITIEGECIILPSTIVPNPNDFFTVNHLKMKAVFQIIDVQYDSMKPEGYYKIRYRLQSTSDETLLNLSQQTVETYYTDLDAVGSVINPVIQKDDFVKRSQIQQMVNKMIQSYHSVFYNERHNCFLYEHLPDCTRWFDVCGNEFIAKHGIMNIENSSKVIVLHSKLRNNKLTLHYNNSIYTWIELGCSLQMLQKFYFSLNPSEDFIESSFARWGDNDIQIMHPINPNNRTVNDHLSIFTEETFNTFAGSIIPSTVDEQLIWKYIHQPTSISIHDISLTIADMLLLSSPHFRVYMYTPILIYIIRKILRMN